MLRRNGFSSVRWYIEMTRRLVGDGSQPIPEVELAAGLRVVPFDRELDEQVRLAHNEAFADHWGSEPRSAEDWQRATTGGRNFRPDWSFLVLADSDGGQEVAGYTLASAYEQDWEAQGYTAGWTDLLGVRPAWRGRRLAPALLAASMQAMLDSGMERAELGVDSENASGALGLYGGLGYAATRREVAWAKAVE
jgi:ribosomal protein S18 acetylase RimI-like enzyme